MRRLIGFWRLLVLVTHCLAGFLTIALLFPRLDASQREKRVMRSAKRTLDKLGVELISLGQPAISGPVMLVANHSSWLDILVLHASLYCRFTAKQELTQWPVIGMMAARSGTLFLERRSNRDALRVVHDLARCLQNGDVVAIFPEGTTSDGSGLLPFHGNLLQAAISAGAPVQPICIQYRDSRSNQRSTVPNYVGEEHFLTSFWRTLCDDRLLAQVHFGEVQLANGRSRRLWANDLYAEVGAMQQIRPSDAGSVNGPNNPASPA